MRKILIATSIIFNMCFLGFIAETEVVASDLIENNFSANAIENTETITRDNYMSVEDIVKTATLSSINVSFNGDTPVNIQCYNIDNNNYVQARAITQNLNMGYRTNVGLIARGINFFSDYEMNVKYPYIYKESFLKNKFELLNLSETTILSTIQKYELCIDDGGTIIVDAFEYNGEMFIDITSLNALSNADLEYLVKNNEGYTKYNNLTSVQNEYDKMTIQKNNETNIYNINVNRVATVIENLIQDVAIDSNIVEITTQNVVVDNNITTDKNILKVAKNQVHTTAPIVGEIYAKPVIDETQPIYAYSEKYNSIQPVMENFTEYYQSWTGYNNVLAEVGQCTWYARGRFAEVTGLKVSSIYSYFTDGNVKEDTVKVITDLNKIQAPSIAVWSGHVVFIEYVEYDTFGNVKNLYFSEANRGNTEVGNPYRPTIDGQIQKSTLEEFKIRSTKTLQGYIVPKTH